MATPRQSPYPSLSTTQCQSFAIRALRNDFLAQPLQRLGTALERVQRLLEVERRRGQLQPSYLMLHHRAIYGISFIES